MDLNRMKKAVSFLIASMCFILNGSAESARVSLHILSYSKESEYINVLGVYSPKAGGGIESPYWPSDRIGVLCMLGKNEDHPMVTQFTVRVHMGEGVSESFVAYATRSSDDEYSANVYECIFPRNKASWPQGCSPVLFRVPISKIVSDEELGDVPMIELSIVSDVLVYNKEVEGAVPIVVESEFFEVVDFL